MSSTVPLEIQKIKSNTRSRVIIDGFIQDSLAEEGGPPVVRRGSSFLPPSGQLSSALVGYFTEDFQFQGSNSWNDPQDDSSAVDLTTILGKLGELRNRYTGTNIKDKRVKSVAGTIKSWSGSSSFPLSLDLIHVAVEEEDDTLGIIRQLTAATYPTFGGGKARNAWLSYMFSPNAYVRGDVNEPNGTFSVTIGDWFQSTKMFLITSFSSSIGSLALRSGMPMIVRTNIQMETYRAVSATEVTSWIQL